MGVGADAVKADGVDVDVDDDDDDDALNALIRARSIVRVCQTRGPTKSC